MSHQMHQIDQLNLALAHQTSRTSSGSSSSSFSPPHKPVDIEYEHPKLVDSVKEGWLNSYQAIAVVAALFAGMEASLIGVVKTPDPTVRFTRPEYQNAVLGLAYVALALNVGCILSALKVIDLLGRTAYWNALRETAPDPAWILSGEAGLMGSYGVKGRTRLLMNHCFYCLFVGSLCVLAQLIMYVWLHEDIPVVWATLVAIIIASVPMLLMVW